MLTITLAHVLRTKRREAGLTQSKLSEMTDIPRPRLSLYERGRIFPPSVHIVALSRSLGVDADFLARLCLDPVVGRPQHPGGQDLCRVFRPPERYRPPKDRDSAVRVSAARHSYSEVVDILRNLEARDDWRQTRIFFHDLWCDSRLEGRAWLGLLSERARAVQVVPYRRGFEHLIIVHPVTREIVGARATAALFWPNPLPTLLVPQMTVLTPSVGPCRVDGVVMARVDDCRRYLVVEVDGAGHDSSSDRQRELALKEVGLPVLRLGEAEVRKPDLCGRISAAVPDSG